MKQTPSNLLVARPSRRACLWASLLELRSPRCSKSCLRYLTEAEFSHSITTLANVTCPSMTCFDMRALMESNEIEDLNRRFEHETPETFLAWAAESYPNRLRLACSFGAEDVVLVVAAQANVDIVALHRGCSWSWTTGAA